MWQRTLIKDHMHPSRGNGEPRRATSGKGGAGEIYRQLHQQEDPVQKGK